MLVFRSLITFAGLPIIRDHGYCPQDRTALDAFDITFIYEYITNHGYCPQDRTALDAFDITFIYEYITNHGYCPQDRTTLDLFDNPP